MQRFKNRPFSPIVDDIYFLTRKTCFRLRDEQKAITMHNAMYMYLPEGNAFPYLQASKIMLTTTYIVLYLLNNNTLLVTFSHFLASKLGTYYLAQALL